LELEIKEIQIEMAKCAMDFRYFLKYVKIVETPSLESRGGVAEFQLWPHIKEAVECLLHDKLIVWLKSRQIGASWLIAAYCLWYALFKDGATILLLSAGESEAMWLLSKCHSILDNLPIWLQVKPNPDSRTEMGFTCSNGEITMKSVIKALPSTEKAGVSYTASVIVCDEWDLHEYAVENFMQIKPCIDSSGGQFIGVFTRDPQGGDSLAVSTFVNAREGKNGFKWIFHPYTVRPRRDEEWYARKKAELTPDILRGMSPDIYMQKAYPRSVEEALSVSAEISVFNPDVVRSMLEDCRNPLMIEEIDNSIIHVYKPFQLGHYYISSCDVSHGVGRDFTVAGVMDCQTGEIVADIYNNHLAVDSFTDYYYTLLKLYNEPKAYPEDNEWGHFVCMGLQKLNYKNLAYQDEQKTRPGFKTGQNRTQLYENLAPAINNRQIVIYNKDGVKQLFDLIRNSDKEGRIEAKRGGHDDYAIMLGICWLMKDTIQQVDFVPKTISSLHFNKNNSRLKLWGRV